ncbi:MAG: DUF2589 domain-containing protein [Kiloniellaceae bacterium]
MMKLEELVSVVQKAVLSAASALAQQNLDIFQDYFEEITDGDELISRVHTSLASVASAIESSDQSTAETSLRDAAEALRNAAESVRRQAGGEDGSSEGQLYVPKRMVLQYPTIEHGVPGVQHVQVPLITLAPVSMPEVTEVRFKAELELSIDDDDNLRVSFPQRRSPRSGAQSAQQPNAELASGRGGTAAEGSTATLEIVINGRQPADGLLKVIEGYEKALRAQIPG